MNCRLALMLAAAVGSAGCVSTELIGKQPDATVCRAYAAYRNSGVYPGSTANIRAELLKRGLLTESEIEQADKRTIRVGDGLCAMYAALGTPRSENRSVGSWGTDIQHVFGRSTYVYTRNGRITSWQE